MSQFHVVRGPLASDLEEVRDRIPIVCPDLTRGLVRDLKNTRLKRNKGDSQIYLLSGQMPKAEAVIRLQDGSYQPLGLFDTTQVAGQKRVLLARFIPDDMNSGSTKFLVLNSEISSVEDKDKDENEVVLYTPLVIRNVDNGMVQVSPLSHLNQRVKPPCIMPKWWILATKEIA